MPHTSRMPESGSSGSVRGALRNERPYRERRTCQTNSGGIEKTARGSDGLLGAWIPREPVCRRVSVLDEPCHRASMIGRPHKTGKCVNLLNLNSADPSQKTIRVRAARSARARWRRPSSGILDSDAVSIRQATCVVATQTRLPHK